MAAPLAGLKVIELARILAGPWAGQTSATSCANCRNPRAYALGESCASIPLSPLISLPKESAASVLILCAAAARSRIAT